MFASGLPLVVENIMEGPKTFDQIVAVVNAEYRQDRSRLFSDEVVVPSASDNLWRHSYAAQFSYFLIRPYEAFLL